MWWYVFSFRWINHIVLHYIDWSSVYTDDYPSCFEQYSIWQYWHIMGRARWQIDIDCCFERQGAACGQLLNDNMWNEICVLLPYMWNEANLEQSCDVPIDKRIHRVHERKLCEMVNLWNYLKFECIGNLKPSLKIIWFLNQEFRWVFRPNQSKPKISQKCAQLEKNWSTSKV